MRRSEKEQIDAAVIVGVCMAGGFIILLIAFLQEALK